MAIAHEFEYIKPKSLPEVLDLLESYKEKARILAGATDLLVRIKEGFETPDVVIDIKALQELQKIEMQGNRLFIGACVSFSELINSEIINKNYPLIKEASATVASVGTRNRATMVGNICSAIPSLDSAPALLNYNAIVLVADKNGNQEIPIQNWFLAPKRTALKPNQVVLGIFLPEIGNHGSCYLKLGRYSGEDLAQAGVAVVVLPNKEYRVSFCAVGPIPKRSVLIEKELHGKDLTDDLVAKVVNLSESEISPISDIRASKEYRIHMIKVMLERGFKTAVSRINKK